MILYDKCNIPYKIIKETNLSYIVRQMLITEYDKNSNKSFYRYKEYCNIKYSLYDKEYRVNKETLEAKLPFSKETKKFTIDLG